jgi:3-oxoacyl-[acyl-carrier-protein] synthase-1
VTLGDLDPSKLAFINAHGTATPYNDEMESIAIERAGLAGVPVNSLKGYYGHTMGAAGVLETIISMQAVDDHNILATRGFDTLGVTHHLDVTNKNRNTEKRAFIKLLSGFGGCNAALLMAKGGPR